LPGRDRGVVLDPGVVAAGGLVLAQAVLVLGLVVEQRHQQAARLFTTPALIELDKPQGAPIASTVSPGRRSSEVTNFGVGESLRLRRLHLQHRQVGQRVGADQLRRQLAPVGEHDAEALAVLGHVRVGGDVAPAADDRAAAAGHAERRLALR
jgi:hypothetical protein